MDQQLKEKIKQLRELYPDDDSSQFLNEAEKDIRRKIAQSNLKDMEVVQLIIEEAKRKINGINTLLQFDEDLLETKRKALFKERSVHQFYLDRFDSNTAETKMAALDKFLDAKIAEAGE